MTYRIVETKIQMSIVYLKTCITINLQVQVKKGIPEDQQSCVKQLFSGNLSCTQSKY